MTEAGAAESIRWYDELCFLEPKSGSEPRRSWMRSGALPAPMHQTMSFLRAPMLGLRDKAAIAAGLVRFLRGAPESDAESFANWLQRTGQTERAVRHFWEPVVLGALNDSFDRCSVKYAGKIFHESFLRSAEGRPAGDSRAAAERVLRTGRAAGDEAWGRGSLGMQAWTQLSEGLMAAGWFVPRRGGDRLRGGHSGQRSSHGAEAACDDSGRPAGGVDFEKFVVAPITTVHLWYDREVVDLDHAVLLDTRIQWMFAKSRIRRWPSGSGAATSSW